MTLPLHDLYDRFYGSRVDPVLCDESPPPTICVDEDESQPMISGETQPIVVDESQAIFVDDSQVIFVGTGRLMDMDTSVFDWLGH